MTFLPFGVTKKGSCLGQYPSTSINHFGLCGCKGLHISNHLIQRQKWSPGKPMGKWPIAQWSPLLILRFLSEIRPNQWISTSMAHPLKSKVRYRGPNISVVLSSLCAAIEGHTSTTWLLLTVTPKRNPVTGNWFLLMDWTSRNSDDVEAPDIAAVKQLDLWENLGAGEVLLLSMVMQKSVASWQNMYKMMKFEPVSHEKNFNLTRLESRFLKRLMACLGADVFLTTLLITLHISSRVKRAGQLPFNFHLGCAVANSYCLKSIWNSMKRTTSITKSEFQSPTWKQMHNNA